MRHVMAIADDELFARVKVSAARAKRTVQGQVEVLLARALADEESPSPVDPERPPVVREGKGTPVAAVCRGGGHEARKDGPRCIVVGGGCRRVVGRGRRGVGGG